MNEATTIASGALSGASLGSVAGPWGTLIGGVAGAGLGVYQAYGNQGDDRPTYHIPDEVKQNLTAAQQRALEGLPEEQKQLFLSNLQRGTAYGLKELGNRKAGLSGVAAINQQNNDAIAGLMSADASARSANQKDLMAARSEMGQYQDQSFQINSLSPYYENQAQDQAQQGANTQNIMNSVGNIASIYGNPNGRKPASSKFAGFGANTNDLGISYSGYEDASYNPFQNVG